MMSTRLERSEQEGKIHSLNVKNSYILHSILPPEHKVYTVLNVTDAFFSMPLLEWSEPIFSFKRPNPELGLKGQSGPDRIEFKISSTILNEALNQDLHLSHS